jgi:hypothetical protein
LFPAESKNLPVEHCDFSRGNTPHLRTAKGWRKVLFIQTFQFFSNSLADLGGTTSDASDQ